MALTNALLKSMNIEGDQRDQIMSAHQETLESIKKERDELRDKAAKVDELEKQVKELQEKQPTEDWQKRYDEEHAAFEEYKTNVANAEAAREKSELYRSLLTEQGIDPKRIDSIMKVTDLSGISVIDGQIADKEKVVENIASEWSDFVIHEATAGAKVDNPSKVTNTGMTKQEIMAIKDAPARQKAIAENIELFR